MSDVKIGDKVVVTFARETGGYYKNGDVAVVVQVHCDDSIDVQFEHHNYGLDDHPHYLYENEYRVFHQNLYVKGQKPTVESLKQTTLSARQECEKMTKFKAGDVVTPTPVNGEIHTWLVRGNKYVVKNCYAEGLIDVEGEVNKPGHGRGWSTDWFELTEKRATTSTAESIKELIFSIRQEREQTLSKLKNLDAEEDEAISQLNALGFSLFEEEKADNSSPKTVLYAQDIEEDMTDPENWEVGDMIQCVNGKGWEYWIDEGEIAEMIKPLSPQLHLKTKYGMQNFGSSYYKDFKFHSRPVK